MVELNGTKLNGHALNGKHVNGSWVPPSSLPNHDPDMSADHDERARLVAEVAAANARTAAARERVAAREAEVRAALHAELVASRELLAEMERQHDVAIAMIRSAAQAEVERILAAGNHPSAGSVCMVADDALGANDDE